MYCPSCGNETPEGRFCAKCGSQLAPAQPPQAVPQPGYQQPPQQVPPPGYQQPPAPAPAPKKRGCLKGCLLTLLVLTLVALVACGWLFRWPEKIGLVASPAERMFEEGGLSPVADAALMADLESRGFEPSGALCYVADSLETDGAVALFILDESEGFAWYGDYASPVESLMVLVATSEAAQDLGVVRVAVDYRDSAGDQVLVMTGPTDVIRAYGEGSASRDEFIGALDVKTTPQQLVESQLGWLR